MDTKTVVIRIFDKVDALAPFGSGNNEPKFIVENVKIVNSQIVGEKHLKVILCDRNGKTINGISFNAIGTNLEGYLNKKSHKMINILGKMSSNNWKPFVPNVVLMTVFDFGGCSLAPPFVLHTPGRVQGGVQDVQDFRQDDS